MPAAAAAAAVASRAPLAFADQATWQQCLSDPCQEYADSIYQHLRATELAHFPDPLYMDTVQGDLTHAMRSILVDWLVEVAEEYKLAPQSLFLAVSYLDRFLSRQQIDRSRLQLVGVTALLLAAKYWEIYPPAIDEFVYISDHTYTKAEVLAMENSLLTALHFKLTTPTSWEFSRRFCKAANADKQTEHLVDVSDKKKGNTRPCVRTTQTAVDADARALWVHVAVCKDDRISAKFLLLFTLFRSDVCVLIVIVSVSPRADASGERESELPPFDRGRICPVPRSVHAAALSLVRAPRGEHGHPRRGAAGVRQDHARHLRQDVLRTAHAQGYQG